VIYCSKVTSFNLNWSRWGLPARLLDREQCLHLLITGR
jgi:hypothetical protein